MSRPVNNGFGELPEDRGDNQTLFGYISLGVFMFCLSYYRFWYSLDYITMDDIYLFGLVFFSIMLGRAFRTCLLLTEEVKHLSSRYGNCMKKAIRACLSLPEVEFLVKYLFVFVVFIRLIYQLFSVIVINGVRRIFPGKFF